MWSNCHHLCPALCDVAVNGGMTHSTSKASCKPNVSPSDLIWPLKAKVIQLARNEQPAVSVHKWSFKFVRFIMWYITVVSHKQKKPSLTWTAFYFEEKALWFMKTVLQKGAAAWQTSSVRDTLRGIHARECRKLYVISLTVELFHFSFV